MPRAKAKELTRVQAAGKPKWRKIYGGKLYHFRGSYEEALTEWQRKKVELDQPAEQPAPSWQYKLDLLCCWLGDREASSHSTTIREIFARCGAMAGQWLDAQTQLRLDTADDDWAMPEEYDNELAYADLANSLHHFLDQHYIDRGEVKATMRGAVDGFLTRQSARVQTGEISAGYYDLSRRCLNHFVNHVGPNAAVKNINGLTLSSYHTALLEQIQKGWTADYAEVYIRSMKSFVTWCWETELIDNLPRNIKSKTLSIAIQPKKLKTFTNEEIRTLLSYANERTRLYFLLMLNTSMSQKDLSDLAQEEVDWERGRIIRKRSKTKDAEGVPTVEYVLWPETLELLRKFADKKGERVLVNQDGGQLKTEELRNGRLNKIDNIATSYHRLLVKLRANGIKISKSLKIFRKTSPSRLTANKDYANCATWFLGHSPRGVAAKHYLALTQETFDGGVLWLREEYAIAQIKPQQFPKKKRTTKEN